MRVNWGKLRPYDGLPSTVFGVAVVEHPGGEARVAWIRLPVWGFEYCPWRDEYRWGCRFLIYHGRIGFRLTWMFPEATA